MKTFEEKIFDIKVKRIQTLAIDGVAINIFKLKEVEEYARKVISNTSIPESVQIEMIRMFATGWNLT